VHLLIRYEILSDLLPQQLNGIFHPGGKKNPAALKLCQGVTGKKGRCGFLAISSGSE